MAQAAKAWSEDSAFSPWLLRTAYRQVKQGLSREPLYDVAEDLAIAADPMPALFEIAQALDNGSYRPQPMPLIPFPKGGDCIRPYCSPTIRDQIAFVTLLNLLGPLVDRRMSNKSFGGRLFRPLVPDERGKLVTGRYSLNERPLYLNFERSYGLFRRVAQRLVTLAVRKDAVANRFEGFHDVAVDDLPYLANELWMNKWQENVGPVYWLRLDLRLAFPSINRERLHADLAELADETVRETGQTVRQDLDRQFLATGDHPWSDSRLHETTKIVLERLGKALAAARYQPWIAPPGATFDNVIWTASYEIPEKARLVKERRLGQSWPPDCHLAGADARSAGIPTGLLASASLLNVALASVDRKMEALGESLPDLVYLRYMDDVLVMARKPTTVVEAYRVFQEALAGSGHSLELNEQKVYPEDFAQKPDLRRALLERHAISAGNEDQFATEVVREVSGDQEERDDWLHGASSDRSLDRLLLLAELKHDDDELPTDARMSYALAGIANRPWPLVKEESKLVASDEFLDKIRSIAARAIEQYPWRFRSWRHAIIIAIRTDALRGAASTLQEGHVWLASLVHRLISRRPLSEILGGRSAAEAISFSRWTSDVGAESGVDEAADDLSWVGAQFTDDKPSKELQILRASRHLRSTFQRAVFLRAYHDVLQTLYRIANGNLISARPGTWFSAIPQLRAADLIGSYGSLEGILSALYGGPAFTAPVTDPPRDGGHTWWWEREALAQLLIGVDRGTTNLLHLPVPQPGALRQHNPALAKELALAAGRMAPPVLTILEAGGADAPLVSGFPQVPTWNWLARMAKPSLVGSVSPGNLAELAALHRLGGWKRIGLQSWDTRIHRTATELPGVWGKADRLRTYHHVRRLVLGYGNEVPWEKLAWLFPEVPTLHATQGEQGTIRARDLMYAHASDRPTGIRECLTPVLQPMIGEAEVLMSTVVWPDGSFVHPGSIACNPSEAEPWMAQRRLQANPASIGETGRPELPPPPKWQLTPTATDPAPHEAFLVPFLFLGQESTSPWQRLALEMWFRTAGERILDHLVESGPFSPAYWQLRAWSAETMAPLEPQVDALFGHSPIATVAFAQQKLLSSSVEVVPVRLFPYLDAHVAESLQVVIVQAKAEIDAKLVLEQAAKSGAWRVQLPQAIEVESELAQVLQEIRNRSEAARVYAKTRPVRRHGSNTPSLADETYRAPDLLLLPEWYALEAHLPSLRDFVASTGVAIAVGLFPVELPPVAERHSSVETAGSVRLLANEAAVIVPERSAIQLTAGRTRTITLRFRKPEPSIAERALIEALTDSGSGTWAFGRGHTWPLFSHPRWGMFSLAICSDLLNTLAWGHLRGRIQHMFLLAFNRAVDLFDQFTYTRGYELYANLVLCNHATRGGSVAWTPLRKAHEAQLFHVHGRGHQVTAYVDLPAERLRLRQRGALADAVGQAKAEWLPRGSSSKPDDWWAPPPGYNFIED